MAVWEKYEKLKVLGQGAYGSAILVKRQSNGEKFVVKQIPLGDVTEEAKQQALEEAKVLRKMSYTNIVAYEDLIMDGDHLFIVMEYANGGDLSAAVKRRKKKSAMFDEQQVMFLFVQICLAVDHIHRHKIIHRDLKGMNIFLTSEGVVKVGDFGIAKSLGTTSAQAQTVIGTPLYLPPEVCNNEPYSYKADVWSMGVILYELCTLGYPFQGQSVPGLVMKIITTEPEPISDKYSPPLSDLVKSLLQKEAENRPRTSDILAKSYVQGHINKLVSHTIVTGAGGAEALLAGGRMAKEKQQRQQHAATNWNPREGQVDSKVEQRKAQAQAQLERERAARSRQDAITYDAAGKPSSHKQRLSRGQSEAVPSTRSSEDRKDGPRYKEQRKGGIKQSPSIAREEFFKNRQLAAATKAKIEGLGEGGADSQAKLQTMHRETSVGALTSHAENPAVSEQNAAEVRARAKREKEQKEAQRKQALADAIAQQQAEREALRRRMEERAAAEGEEELENFVVTKKPKSSAQSSGDAQTQRGARGGDDDRGARAQAKRAQTTQPSELEATGRPGRGKDQAATGSQETRRPSQRDQAREVVSPEADDLGATGRPPRRDSAEGADARPDTEAAVAGSPAVWIREQRAAKPPAQTCKPKADPAGGEVDSLRAVLLRVLDDLPGGAGVRGDVFSILSGLPADMQNAIPQALQPGTDLAADPPTRPATRDKKRTSHAGGPRPKTGDPGPRAQADPGQPRPKTGGAAAVSPRDRVASDALKPGSSVRFGTESTAASERDEEPRAKGQGAGRRNQSEPQAGLEREPSPDKDAAAVLMAVLGGDASSSEDDGGPPPVDPGEDTLPLPKKAAKAKGKAMGRPPVPAARAQEMSLSREIQFNVTTESALQDTMRSVSEDSD
mmetsp:Transcript_63372/g.145769  ORF Transcript_63372/g.145769 Transcript_63372/m.145769 type:complete len:898 (+) Transcript_63372:94-2787(+)